MSPGRAQRDPHGGRGQVTVLYRRPRPRGRPGPRCEHVRPARGQRAPGWWLWQDLGSGAADDRRERRRQLQAHIRVDWPRPVPRIMRAAGVEVLLVAHPRARAPSGPQITRLVAETQWRWRSVTLSCGRDMNWVHWSVGGESRGRGRGRCVHIHVRPASYGPATRIRLGAAGGRVAVGRGRCATRQSEKIERVQAARETQL
mmetsp:Transcript_21991/g.73944  ORF Transcript_21991/g.73944 Transcript_21991/m.73944 type:complete len:201 (-) Transcript_21991:615-1217(-)